MTGSQGQRAIDYSIIVPVYYNQETLPTVMETLQQEVFDKVPNWCGEVIFVDDGSGDRSLDVLLALRQRKPDTVRVIKLTRNFGQVAAMLAGFAHAKGRCVIAMSADGQDPPELVRTMLEAHFTEGYETVVLRREGRDDSRYRIWTSKVFYWLMRKLSFPHMPSGGFDFVLIGRRALEALVRHRESHPFFQGQILWLGYRTKFIGYHRAVRKAGRSRWTFQNKLSYLIDGVIGYSFLPIRMISLTGILTALLGFAYAILIFTLRVTRGHPVQGWAPLMITTLLMGGVQMIMLGVIGEYLWRALAQVRNREPYVIDVVYENDP